MQQSCINALIALALVIALKKYAPEMYDIVLEIALKMLTVISEALDAMSS